MIDRLYPELDEEPTPPDEATPEDEPVPDEEADQDDPKPLDEQLEDVKSGVIPDDAL